MKVERRRAERVRVDIEVQWEGESGPHKGVIHDINMNGCFMFSSGAVRDGEMVNVQFNLPRKKSLALWGEVVNHLDEIGFGMKFNGAGKTESDFVKRLIERAKKELAKAQRSRTPTA